MATIFFLLFLVCLLGLIIGLISPKAVIRWGTKRTRGQALLIYGVGLVIFLILGVITSSPTEEEAKLSSETVSPVTPEQKTESLKVTSTPPVEQKIPPTSLEVSKKEISPEEEKPEAEPKEEWVKIKRWRGSSDKKTEPFEIEGEQWRIKWSFTASDPHFGLLTIFIYRPGSDVYEDVIQHSEGSASDVSYFYTQGRFYLDISCANGSWSVTVEELR